MSMKCPQCGAWALIKETRTKKTENVVTRRYECANLHRFTTEEKVKNDTNKSCPDRTPGLHP